jgi:hypothetical protein
MEIYKREFKTQEGRENVGAAMRTAHRHFGRDALVKRFQKISKKEVWTNDKKTHKCHIAMKSKTERYKPRSDGSVQLSAGSVDRKQINVYASTFALYTKTGEIPVDSTWSCSHLCHHPDCCNPEHIILEKMWQNVRRQECENPDSCTCSDNPAEKCINEPTKN